MLNNKYTWYCLIIFLLYSFYAFAYKLYRYKAEIDRLDGLMSDNRFILFDLESNKDREIVKRILELNQQVDVIKQNVKS